jgi:hypothetical protein
VHSESRVPPTERKKTTETAVVHLESHVAMTEWEKTHLPIILLKNSCVTGTKAANSRKCGRYIPLHLPGVTRRPDIEPRAE